MTFAQNVHTLQTDNHGSSKSRGVVVENSNFLPEAVAGDVATQRE